MTSLGQLNDLQAVVLSALVAAVEVAGGPVTSIDVGRDPAVCRHGIAVFDALEQLEEMGRVQRHVQPKRDPHPTGEPFSFPGPRADRWTPIDRSEA